jgi:capsular polysaccharide transport system permease protein
VPTALNAAADGPGRLRRIETRSFATFRTIGALILREMATTYGRSAGGYAWTVLEPAGGIAMLTLIFSLGFRSPPLGINFPIFYATGLVPFLMYLDISGKMSTSVMFSKQLLAYPAVTYVDAILARFILSTLTQLMVGYVIFTGILVMFETRTTLELDRIALGFAMTAALALGVGTMNCFLMSMYPVWQRIWSILNRPLFLLSCIFFTFETVPEPYRDILWYVPTVHLTGIFRAAFYPGYDATYVSPIYVFGLSGLLLMTGLLFLRRYYRDILSA